MDKNRVCKISDFGMSVEIKFDEAAESTVSFKWNFLGPFLRV